MGSRIGSFVLNGVSAEACEIEVDVSDAGLSRTTIVGLPDAAVRESTERVRTALIASGYGYPVSRIITINLAPAHVRKEGSVYDLPIALAILDGAGTVALAAGLRRTLVAGELALDGRIRPIRGAIGLALMARRAGQELIVPSENAGEAALAGGCVRGAATLDEAVGHLAGRCELPREPCVDIEARIRAAAPTVDFGDVRGQLTTKRALTIAAAGGHNALMLGPAGTGKSMMARSLPGILPPLTAEEALDVTRIHSVARALPPGDTLLVERPVRAPHHTASAASIIGGGSVPRPGEVSLAHHGVLFLDETPEFSRTVLETLRQPLEDGVVTIARAQGTVEFPARFMLIGALNPTPGGRSGAEALGTRETARYLARISGPLVDRIDLHVEVPTVEFATLAGRASGPDTASMRRAVAQARMRQRERQGDALNAHLGRRHLDRIVPLDGAAMAILEDAVTTLGLSARAYDKLRRVARTIADLDGVDAVSASHVAEAVQYRLLDRMG